MHTLTGFRPRATESAKFAASIPAEKEIGYRSPNLCRNRRTSAMASTCSGAPERYISFSVPGKKVLWFRTMRVLVNFTPKPRPLVPASAPSRSTKPTTCSHFASFSKAASGTARSA